MKKFKKLYIEITNICNLSCSFCYKSILKPKSLTKESFQHILNEVKPHADHIYLHVKGEPLLHPQINEFLDMAHEFNLKVNITTNGVLINKVKEEFLNKPAIRQINFSLHSFTENKKENYLADILDFTHEALEKTNMIIALRLWNFNKEDESTNGKNKMILNAIETQFYGDNKLEENLVTGKGLKIREHLYLNTDFEFEWPDLKSTYHNEKGFCYALREQIAILADGTVVPCCLDGEGITKLGNIFEQSFIDIIKNERSRAIYDGFTNHRAVEALCMKCRYKERFD